MKRRDFIVKTTAIFASVAGASAMASVPCPPSVLSIDSEASTSSSCAVTPAWFSALPRLQWATPVSNSISQVLDPLAMTTNHGIEGPAGIFNDWTGFATDDTSKAIAFLAQGGHNGYYGNEVYYLDLKANAPRWTRRRNATPAEADASDHSTWSDRRPVSNHGYCIPLGAEGRFFLTGLGSVNFLGGVRGDWFEFDLATNDWVARGNFGSATITGGMASAFDVANRRIIFVRNNFVSPAVQAINVDTFAVAASYGASSAIADGNRFCCAVDTTNNVLAVFASGVWAMNLNNIAAGFNHFTPAGGPAQNSRHVYDPNSRAFLCWDGGQGIQKFTPILGGGSYTGGTWSTINASGLTPPSPRGSAGIFGKIGLLTFGSESALIVAPAYSSPDVYTCKIQAAELRLNRVVGALGGLVPPNLPNTLNHQDDLLGIYLVI